MPGVIYGPKLILSTISLISGERVSFSTQPVSKFMQMSKVNKNVLPLSRVVGASACTPGLFPPAAIAGDGKRQLQDHEFAFIRLFLSLKDRLERNRLPSEYIPAVTRIRTDLDQFSYVETEAWMYHAYTLVDAQINDYCPKLQKDPPVPLTVPPLFRETADPEARREIIRKDLKAGEQNVYLLRCAEKYHLMWWVLGLGRAVGLALVYLAVGVADSAARRAGHDRPHDLRADSVCSSGSPWINCSCTSGCLRFGTQ